MNYKKYIKETYGISDIVIESPSEIPDLFNKFDDDPVLNRREAEKIEKNDFFVGFFKNGKQRFKIYKSVEDSHIFLSVILDSQPFLILTHDIKEVKLNDKLGIESVGIWQHHHSGGFARYWMSEYILKHYDFIMSDKSHTKMGKEFWKKIIWQSLDDGHEPFVYDTKNNNYEKITIDSDITKYWGIDKSNYRLIIYK